MKKSALFGFALILVFAMMLSACGKDNNQASNTPTTSDSSSSAPPSTGEAKPFKISIGINGGSNQLKLAQSKGWFEEEFAKINGKVEWSDFQSGPQAIEALAAKRLDVTTLVDGGVITAISGKVDLKLTSFLSTGLKGVNYVIVPKGSDVKELADLKGKRVGLAKGTTNHVFLVKALKKFDVKESDLNLVNLLITDAQPAFESGQLDAWVTADPFAYQEVTKNGATIIASGESLNIPSPVFVAFRAEFTKEHPEAVEAYLRVMQKAIDYEKANYDEALKAYAELKKQDITLIKVLADNYQAQNEPISDEIVTEFQASANLLLELGFLKEKIDVSKLVDNSFILKK
ncbi:NrtA/SsuA/CpmA family ABC transporter substrate-binding protein [Paenibacillus eucommiae]|uniref:Sulfonate transport system substrate-binding protein n=1 Tax=Paenibacillus eucommiae TaxID=1355755 RepID=A0ABS4J1F8_9BACL|nr:NrtA/SsuA/CpmA family ABC transporter substrate-binding protein [Paenibacillus eucommiae]MBP1993628.1 sulfonate transport system substrate-binding protein [Paenibacillus eucommiae]